MRKRGSKFPFIISNIDRSDRPEMHWWSILDLHPKRKILFFDSLGLSRLKNVVIKDDKKLINKILFCLEKFKLADDKLTPVQTTFS